MQKMNWDRKAMQFESARYIRRRRMLDVTFENGDHFLLATESLFPTTNHVQANRTRQRGAKEALAVKALDWTNMRIGETGDVLEVPAVEAVIEIPWDRIRIIADPSFQAFWGSKAEQWRSRMGKRIRAMRLEAELSRVLLGNKVGVPRETISDLECGKIGPSPELIERIAVALGRPMSDFSRD
jgi:DNA-binding XRE family transcriptional regulator